MILLIILSALVYFDIKYRLIPNIITYPAILSGCILTGEYTAVIGAFILTGICVYLGFFAGGDVKLFSVIAAFWGIKFIVVFIASFLALVLYRKLSSVNKPLPFAPFVLLGALIA